jgi:hypothetical protein
MDYNVKKGDSVRAQKPPSSNRREPGPFDHTTTNRQDYKVFDGHRQRTSYRPIGSRYMPDGPFDVCYFCFLKSVGTWKLISSLPGIYLTTFRQQPSTVPTLMGKQRPYSERCVQ